MGHVRIVEVPSLDLPGPVLRTRRRQTFGRHHGPPADHRVGHFRMELKAEGAWTHANGLGRKIVAGRQGVGPDGTIEAFAMPVIDMARPARAPRFAQGFSGRRGHQWVIADLRAPFRMLPHRRAQMLREHLRPEAQAQIGLCFPQRNLQPIDLGFYIIVRIIGAHGAAENHRAGVVPQGVGKRIAEPRAPDIQRMPALPQQSPNPARRGMLLMKNDQDRRLGAGFSHRAGSRLRRHCP